MPWLKRVSSPRCLASLPNSKSRQNTHLVSSPPRLNLRNETDPVFFIETNGANTSISANDEVAKSDMKQYLVARVDSALSTDNGNFGFPSQDQYYEYRYQWFYKMVNGQWHRILVNHATYLYNRSIRYVIYKDMDTQQVFGWYQIVVLP